MEQNEAATMMRYDANKKSALVGYLLWWFLGCFGAHHYYMGRIGTGIAMAVLFWVSTILTLILIGVIGLLAWFIWWIIDAIQLNGQIEAYNNRLADQLSPAPNA